MCNPASFVLTKTKVFWSKTSDSHEDIVAEFNLGHMDRLPDPGIVRVEISPPDSELSLPTEQWIFRTDQDILPDWYDPIEAEERTRMALQAWDAAKVIREGQRRIDSGVLHVYDATVKAYDQATVEAHDQATVEAYGQATVEAYGQATVEAYGQAAVEAYGQAAVIKWDSYANVSLFVGSRAVLVDRSEGKVECFVAKEIAL